MANNLEKSSTVKWLEIGVSYKKKYHSVIIASCKIPSTVKFLSYMFKLKLYIWGLFFW